MRKKRLPAYFTVEASFVMPLSVGLFLFCMGLFFYSYDRGILFQNMLRRGVVAQMAMDVEADHTISLLPVWNLEQQEITWSKESDYIRVGAVGREHGVYSQNGLLSAGGIFVTDYEMELPIYEPVKHIRNARKLAWVLEQAKDIVTE